MSPDSGGGRRPPKLPSRLPKPPVTVQISTTGRGHPVVTPDMLKKKEPKADHVVQPRRKRSPTTEQEKLDLRKQVEELEWERRKLETATRDLKQRERALEAQWPPDLTRPQGIRTVDAIDWSEQPAIPAEKIDWSQQGEPLRVKPTLGSLMTVVVLLVSLFSAGAYFYWGVRLHINNKQIHVPNDGVPWGVKSQFETKKEAQTARTKLRKDISETVRKESGKLEGLIRSMKPKRRRYRRR